jgi:hypothetical protein
MLYEYGGHLYNSDSSPTKATVNSAAGVKAMTLWYNAIKAGSVKPIPAGNFADQADFQNQKTAMYISTQVSYQFIVRPIGNKFKFAEAAFPAGDKGVKDEMFGANLCVFNKSAKDVQHGALLYMKYMTSQASTSEWAQKTSYMPVRQSAFKALQDSFYSQNPNQAIGPSMVSKGELIVLPSTPSSNEQRDALSTELGNISGRPSCTVTSTVRSGRPRRRSWPAARSSSGRPPPAPPNRNTSPTSPTRSRSSRPRPRWNDARTSWAWTRRRRTSTTWRCAGHRASTSSAASRWRR